MKSLKSLLEKLRIDDIPDISGDFPADGPIEDIVKFLEDCDFENFDDYDLDIAYFREYAKFFNKQRKKLFIYNDKGRWVRIADTSMKKISAENPIIVVKFVKYVEDEPKYAIEIDTFWEEYLNKREFKETIKKVLEF